MLILISQKNLPCHPTFNNSKYKLPVWKMCFNFWSIPDIHTFLLLHFPSRYLSHSSSLGSGRSWAWPWAYTQVPGFMWQVPVVWYDRHNSVRYLSCFSRAGHNWLSHGSSWSLAAYKPKQHLPVTWEHYLWRLISCVDSSSNMDSKYIRIRTGKIVNFRSLKNFNAQHPPVVVSTPA